MFRRVLHFSISAILIVVLNPSTASASRSGVEQKNNAFSVGFTYNDDGVASVCSGALIAPTIIITTGHCVLNSKGNFGTDYLFSAPGIALDAAIDPSVVQPKILKVITKPGFQVLGGNETDDLAFIVLDKPLKTSSFIKIATAAQVSSLNDNSLISGYGYGFEFETSKSYSSFVKKYPLSWGNLSSISPSLGTIEITSSKAVACRGDSGGPITATLPSGEEILVGVLSGAANIVNACGTLGADGLYRMRASLVYPFLQFISAMFDLSSVKPSPSPKITKITCVKGKLKKVVSGVKPKCPKGYTLKK